MKLWIDDVRSAPEGYTWVKTVRDAVTYIWLQERLIFNYQWMIDTIGFPHFFGGLEPNIENIQKEIDKCKIEVIDIDHDAGEYAQYGGDYIKLLDWLEETGRNYPIHIHSMNPVGVANMRAIIQKNGWEEIK